MMKKYVMSCLSFIAFTGVTDVFCITFENTTAYPVELTLKKGKMNRTFKHFEYEERVVVINPHSDLREGIASAGEELYLLAVSLMKEGVKQPVDFNNYNNRITYYDYGRSVLSVVPWGNSYRLIHLLQ